MARRAREVRWVLIAFLFGGVTGRLVLAHLGALDVFAKGSKGLTKGLVEGLKRLPQSLRIVFHFATKVADTVESLAEMVRNINEGLFDRRSEVLH